MFSCLAVSSGSSDGDDIDTDFHKKFLNAMISNRLKSLYAYDARGAGGETRSSWELTSQLSNGFNFRSSYWI